MSEQKMPEGTWAITKEDKVKVQSLGRKFHALLLEEVKKDKDFNIKIMYGAFDYVAEVTTQKRKLVSDNLFLVTEAVENAGLLSKIEEPFNPDEPELPAAATPAEAALAAAPAPDATFAYEVAHEAPVAEVVPAATVEAVDPQVAPEAATPEVA